MNKTKFVMAAIAGVIAVSVASAPVFAQTTASKAALKTEAKPAAKTAAKKEKHACNEKECCKVKAKGAKGENHCTPRN